MCHWAEPYGAFPGQAFLHILCLSSFLKYLILIVYDANFLSCFADVKPPSPTKWKMLTTCWLWAQSPRLPGVQGLLKLTPVTPSCPLIISQSENWAGADHAPCDTHPHKLFKKAKIFQRAGDFLGHKPLWLLAWPCNKLFSAPNAYVSDYLASLCVRHTKLR